MSTADRPRPHALLVAGTTSDAGKSVVTTGLCRALRRRGLRVAPFKAQNMSNNSMVTADGAEIGRAQWVQAVAAGAEPEAAMNPVLLKPGSDRRSHVVVMGRPPGTSRRVSSRAAGRRWPRPPSPRSTTSPPGTTSWSARARAARPRSTCAQHDYVNMGLAQHGADPDAGRRGHRPRRRVRGPVRHAGAARRAPTRRWSRASW